MNSSITCGENLRLLILQSLVSFLELFLRMSVYDKNRKKSWGVGESSPYDICRIHRFEITLLSVDS